MWTGALTPLSKMPRPPAGEPADTNRFSASKHFFAARKIQDECGLSQIGLPLSGGFALGAVLLGCFGARADFFWSAESAADSPGVGCGGVADAASDGRSCVGGATFGSAGPEPACELPSPRPWGFEGVFCDEAVIASWRSASSQICVSQPSGQPRSRQICWARCFTASCVGGFGFMGCKFEVNFEVN